MTTSLNGNKNDPSTTGEIGKNLNDEYTDSGESVANNEYPDFCSELRARTKQIHDESDKLVNMKLIVVLTDKKLWAVSLGEFYFVFRTIEECLQRHRGHVILGAIHVGEELYRTRCFESDLEFYLGPSWHDIIKPSAQTIKYCDRLNEISVDSPILLIAYIHSMYLALLAGGQIIKRIVRRSLGVSMNGLSVFEFGDEDTSRLRLKKQVMDSINALKLSRHEKEKIIAEKFKVFEMNNSIVRNIHPTLANYSRLIGIISVVAVGVAIPVYGLLRYFR